MIKVVQTYHYDNDDSRESLKINIFEDGKKVKFFSVHDGENEDNTLSRNFSDVHNITDMMKFVYKAALKGKKVVFEEIEEDDEE